jgi:uncharacterized protein with FMN-binding domain
MRRAPIVIAATIAGTAAVLGFHPNAADRLPVAQPPLTVTAKAGSSSSSSSSSSSVFLGSDVPNRYGDVQVQVVMRAGKIVDVRAVRLPDGDGKSRDINRAAAPQLKQQALQVQSANVDGVSGATYTSDGYRQSLQAALDQAGAAPSAATAPPA